MEILKEKIHHFDIEELACKILGLDYEEIDADTQVIEDKIIEDLDIDLETFQEIVSRLLPLVDVGKSEITGHIFKGFADVENRAWLVKTLLFNTKN